MDVLTILYQDRDIVVCVKPAGVLSQDAGERSMPDLLRRQLDVETVSVVHRLDKEVGGVMVFALSQKAAAGLAKAVQERKLKKIYQAPFDAGAVPEFAHDLFYAEEDEHIIFIGEVIDVIEGEKR